MPKTIKKTIKKVGKPIESTEIAENSSLQSKETPKKGRKNLYDTKIKPNLSDIKRYIECGVTELQLCAYYKVSKTQWTQYKKDNSVLSDLLYHARKTCQFSLVNKAYEAAIGGTYEEITEVEYYSVTDQGEKVVTGGKVTKVTKFNKPDVGMLQFLLINRFPEEYARDPHMVELRKKAIELAKEGKALDQDWGGV